MKLRTTHIGVIMFFLTASITTFGQSGQIKDSYDVINVVLEKENNTAVKLSDKFVEFEKTIFFDVTRISSKEFLSRSPHFIGNKIEDFFSRADFDTMKSQQHREPGNIDNVRIKAEKVTMINLKSEELNRLGIGERVLKITKPLFSADNMKAVLYVETRCQDGCNNGNVYVVRRQNSSMKWEIAYMVSAWME